MPSSTQLRLRLLARGFRRRRRAFRRRRRGWRRLRLVYVEWAVQKMRCAL